MEKTKGQGRKSKRRTKSWENRNGAIVPHRQIQLLLKWTRGRHRNEMREHWGRRLGCRRLKLVKERNYGKKSAFGREEAAKGWKNEFPCKGKSKTRKLCHRQTGGVATEINKTEKEEVQGGKAYKSRDLERRKERIAHCTTQNMHSGDRGKKKRGGLKGILRRRH